MQNGVSMPGEVVPAISEDCLYLNIWTPAATATHRRAVMVWIHGGGYTNGSAAMPLYWGDQLAKQGIIVVTIAYRLGPFGYLCHPALTAESAHRSCGNYGLLDQIAALRWVQRNISAFNGDPSRVTIAGQSAGSMSVSMLLSSPLAKGLFRGAIGQSGGVFEPTQLAPQYQQRAASVGAPSLDSLRALPAARLLGGIAIQITHPVLEPYALPRSPYDAYVHGEQLDVPVLIGSNAEEARSLMDVAHVSAATFDADITARFGALPPPLLAAYPHATDDDARTARLDFERDLRFGWDMLTWARLHAAHSREPVYAYRFERRPPFPTTSIHAGWGASHFAELWYMSDHLDQAPWAWSPADRVLARAMSRYWVNFVKTGDPNAAGLAPWTPYSATQPRVMRLGDTLEMGDVLGVDRLLVFDDVYAKVRGKPFGVR
jgi:para-nitrobenzyl esterase